MQIKNVNAWTTISQVVTLYRNFTNKGWGQEFASLNFLEIFDEDVSDRFILAKAPSFFSSDSKIPFSQIGQITLVFLGDVFRVSC